RGRPGDANPSQRLIVLGRLLRRRCHPVGRILSARLARSPRRNAWDPCRTGRTFLWRRLHGSAMIWPYRCRLFPARIVGGVVHSIEAEGKLMALSPGTRLGPYEIVALVGSGGM